MQKPKMTKRRAVEVVIRELEGWLDTRGVLDTKTTRQLRLLYGVTTDRVVAGVEKFVLPAYDSKCLSSYIRAELEKAHFFSYKIQATEDAEVREKLLQAAKQLKTMTEDDVTFLCRHLTTICRILKA